MVAARKLAVFPNSDAWHIWEGMEGEAPPRTPMVTWYLVFQIYDSKYFLFTKKGVNTIRPF